MVARTVARRLGAAFDLIATYGGPSDFFFERAGLGASTTGVSDRVSGPLDELAELAKEALAGLPRDPSAPAPIAVGALPFDPKERGSLVIPRRATLRDSSGTWALDLPGPVVPGSDDPDTGSDQPDTGSDRADAIEAPSSRRWAGRSAPHEPFRDLQLVEHPSASVYAGLVEAARGRIRAGALDKVVLARTLSVDAGRVLDPKQLLWRLRAVESDGYAYAAPTPRGALVGASPELLAQVVGRSVSLNPLAGSATRHGDPVADRAAGEALLRSEKDRHEHEVVVRSVATALEPLCEALVHAPAPVLHPTANVWHLSTPFSGTLRGDVPGVLAVVAALQPTPAVGGHPASAAMATLRELEPFDRGSYAGPVGWVNGDGDGTWAVALRCAELSGESARLFAGAGIVAESEPASEVEETERKFRAFLDALRWG
jgi:isochorismate synthase